MRDPASQQPIPLFTRAPDQIVFRWVGRAVTAAQFLSDVRALAASLPDATHVLNVCENRYRFAVAFAAALVRGQISLLSGDRSPEGLTTLARGFPGLYALLDGPGWEGPIPAARADVPGDSGGVGEGPPAFPPTQVAALAFTSGSSGAPVGHRKLWGVLAARSRDAGRRFRMSSAAPTEVVGTVPAQHMYGFETTVLLPLHASAASWCGSAFYPEDVRSALAAVAGRRTLVTTPLQLRALLQAGAELPDLERVISATAPLCTELAMQAERRWRTPVWEIFGATEVGSIATRRTAAGDVWTAYPRVRFHAEGGPGTTETMLVTGPFAPSCPLDDLVERLDPMRFRVIGRRTDVVKLGGRRASLEELNRVLTGIDGVVDGCFVAPDNLDERPTARLLAFVVAPDLSLEAVMAGLRARIDPLFLPRRVVRVDRLPRNATGKLPEAAVAALRSKASEP